jgi:tRNA (cmo5U34)-methyltransferase
MTTFDNSTPHLSSVYDKQILNTIPNYGCFHQETVDIVQSSGIAPKIWLDTGAGTGTLIKKCMGAFPETLFILADPSADMLAEAKTKLAGSGQERFMILDPAGTQELVLPHGLRPDVITAIQAHHYLSSEERRAATEICYGMLDKGGIFITFENTRPFTEKGIEIGKRRWGDYQLSKGKDKKTVEKHLERFDVEYFPITVEEHLDLYRECGFETVELFWLSYMQAGFYCIK